MSCGYLEWVLLGCTGGGGGHHRDIGPGGGRARDFGSARRGDAVVRCQAGQPRGRSVQQEPERHLPPARPHGAPPTLASSCRSATFAFFMGDPACLLFSISSYNMHLNTASSRLHCPDIVGAHGSKAAQQSLI